jgi:ribosomal protein S8
MIDILPYIDFWFLNKKCAIEYFSKYDSRVEGWFKGELIQLFEHLVLLRKIDGFRVEESMCKKNIDFCVDVDNIQNFIELKACSISTSSTKRNLKFYFRNNDKGLIKDFKKLDSMTIDNKWVLAFVYPKPNTQEWESVKTLTKIDHPHWQCISRLNNYPEYLFISLWHRI